MTKSATDIMQEILFSAVLDSVMAMKDASKGVPNTLLREISAVHGNIVFADLPPHVQAAIGASVRTAFNKLLKEGYAVAPAIGRPAPPRPSTPRPNSSGGGGRPPIVETKRRPRPRPDDGGKPRGKPPGAGGGGTGGGSGGKR